MGKPMRETPDAPSPVGQRAYLEALSSGTDRGIKDPLDLEEYALREAIMAEQRDYQERVEWIGKRLADIASRKPILITRLLGV